MTAGGAARGARDAREGGRAALLEAVSGWVPERRVSNAELPAHWGVDDAWVRSRTGIGHRHVAGPGVATGDLAFEACRRLLEASRPPRVDALVLATATPDHPCPATAPALAARLGLGAVAAVDVSAVCSGFVYGLAFAQGLVAAGTAQRVLVAGADVYSTLLDPDDRGSGVVFGDGAGAALVAAGASGGRGGAYGELLGFDLGSDGTGYDLITVAGGGARARASGEKGDGYFRMQGRAVFRHAVERMTGSCRSLLDGLGWGPERVDRFVPHQANARILRAVAERVGVPPERCVTHLDRVGNTGAASIPLALADAERRGELRPGDRVLLTSFGGGLTWGSAALRWPGPAIPAPRSAEQQGTTRRTKESA